MALDVIHTDEWQVGFIFEVNFSLRWVVTSPIVVSSHPSGKPLIAPPHSAHLNTAQH